jgi:hypothetical protein
MLSGSCICGGVSELTLVEQLVKVSRALTEGVDTRYPGIGSGLSLVCLTAYEHH